MPWRADALVFGGNPDVTDIFRRGFGREKLNLRFIIINIAIVGHFFEQMEILAISGGLKSHPLGQEYPGGRRLQRIHCDAADIGRGPQVDGGNQVVAFKAFPVAIPKAFAAPDTVGQAVGALGIVARAVGVLQLDFGSEGLVQHIFPAHGLLPGLAILKDGCLDGGGLLDFKRAGI